MNSKPLIRYILHIGTVKISFLKVLFQPAGQREILKTVTCSSEGFDKGVVVDLAKAAESIHHGLKAITSGSKESLIPCRVVVSNGHLKNYTYSSSVYYYGNAHELTMKDVRDVIAQTRSVATIPLNEMIVQAIPQEFLVDNMSGISNPIGLEATRLGVTLRLFTTDYSIYQNLVKATERADIDAREIVSTSLTSAHAVLTQEEKQDGVVLIDVGGHATHVVAFQNSILQEAQSSFDGSEVITEAIARKFNLKMEEARRMKETYASLSKKPDFTDELIPINEKGSQKSYHVSKAQLQEDIQNSLSTFTQKLLDPARAMIKKYAPITQVVVTGGGAKLDGLLELIQEELGCTVRLGIARNVLGDQKVISDPAFVSAIGAIDYSSLIMDPVTMLNQSGNAVYKLLNTAKRWVSEYF